jgi:O-antigen/teichoic acid export membrane protein
MNKFSWTGFLVRVALSAALVFLTFNPAGHSFYHWAASEIRSPGPVVVIAGIALLICWIVFLRSTMQSIGKLGVILALAFLAAVVWLVTTWGWLDPKNTSAMTWVALVVVSLVLAFGLSWSFIRQRLTGQASVDEVGRH